MNIRKIVVIGAALLLSFSLEAQRNRTEKEALKVAQLLYYIDNMYVDTVDVHALTDEAITHLLHTLDPHSSYISADDVARANEAIQGNFEGIGISYQMLSDTVIVNQTIAGCPAEKVGMLAGDRIVKVDTTTVSGVRMKMTNIPKLIRGPKGSMVEITALRRGVAVPIVFRIVRDKIPIHSVDAAYFVAPGIAYIKTNSFSATTTKEMDEALESLRREAKIDALIIDLQGNGGGVMSAAIDMVNRFIPSGKMIVYTDGEHVRREEAFSSPSIANKMTDVPLAVLVDDYSASASEIVSGALQDWDRATVIGRRTFGKGLVQRPLRLNDGSEVRLTIARYYTPSGRNIQKPYSKGVDSYYKEIEARYQHGEMLHPDSISFPDSLKYKTLRQQRTVYGGGGIFPDIFVPLDTTRYTPYFRQVVAKGIFNRMVANYVDAHRKSLSSDYPDFDAFDDNFTLPDDVLSAIHREAAKEKIESDTIQPIASERIMRIQAKAVVAQSLFGTEAFYRVMRSENDALSAAIRLLQNNN